MSIRSALIEQFMNTLHKHSPTQIITLLALIGIETVLEQGNPKIIDRITVIKNSIENLMPQEEQKTIKLEHPKKRERTLTPKITENKIPSNPYHPQRPHVQRHHLDDQAMKLALSQQYDFDTQETQPTYRDKNNKIQNQINQLKSPKSTIESVVSPKQSIKYFIDVKSNDTFNNDTNKLINQSYVSQSCQINLKEQQAKINEYETKLKELQQGLTKEILLDYQQMINEIRKHPSFNETSPEGSLQERQIIEYIRNQEAMKQTELQKQSSSQLLNQNENPQLEQINIKKNKLDKKCDLTPKSKSNSHSNQYNQQQFLQQNRVSPKQQQQKQKQILQQKQQEQQQQQQQQQQQLQQQQQQQQQQQSQQQLKEQYQQQLKEFPVQKQYAHQNVRRLQKCDSQDNIQKRLTVHTPSMSNLNLDQITPKISEQPRQFQINHKPQVLSEVVCRIPTQVERNNSESTFSFLPNNRTKQTTQKLTQRQQSPQNLMQITEKLINSPIIRQVTLKSAGENTPLSRRSEVEKEVQVSNFDSSQKYFDGQFNPSLEQQQNLITDSMSSNSSAFSLFQPNEELKLFFRKELIREEISHDENHDPNGVKYSNIFLKGRMGGSKVF